MAIRTATAARWVDFDGCFNFRDVGGYPGPPGRQIRWRRLFRSDAFQDLGPTDEERIARLGLRTLIDLRTPSEVDAGLRFSSKGSTVHHLPMPDVPVAGELRSVADEAALVAAQYLDVLRRSEDTVREVLAILTDPSSYPAVISCSGGHHRTGIVTAVVLGLAGVPDDVVVADYVTSRDAIGRRLRYVQRPHSAVGRHGPAMLGVLAPAMAGLLGGLRKEHGSLRGYARHIDMAAAVPFLRDNLLSPAG